MKIGLVLSGGGARGFAHIGVLKILKKEGITIDYISGSSAGALAGACYAYDQDIDALEKLVLKIKNLRDVIDISPSFTGLSKGEKVEKYIVEYLTKEQKTVSKANLKLYSDVISYFSKKDIHYTFEDLKIPLKVNATDLKKGEEVVFEKGPLLPAIMASMSYPGFFQAKRYNDKLLVDGGVLNPLPVSLISDDVDFLILVNVSKSGISINEKSGFRDIMFKSVSLMQKQIIKKELSELKKPYVLIEPEVKGSIIDFKNIKKIIENGEVATIKALPEIKKFIQKNN